MNVAEIEMQLADLVAEPFDRNEFVFKFLAVFNPPKASLTKLSNGTMNKAVHRAAFFLVAIALLRPLSFKRKQMLLVLLGQSFLLEGVQVFIVER